MRRPLVGAPRVYVEDKITTPATAVVRKFSLRADGTYTVAKESGHYSFDPATKSITWLDGPHEGFTKTEVKKRDNGAPSIGFTAERRYYGCYMPKP